MVEQLFRSSLIQSVGRETLDFYEEEVNRILDKIAAVDDVKVIAGIPAHQGNEALCDLVAVVSDGLRNAGFSTNDALILITGCTSCEKEMAAFPPPHPDHVPVVVHLLDESLEGRGWGIRAIMDAGFRVGVPVLILPAELVPQTGPTVLEGEGFSPSWVPKLLKPLGEGGQDLVIGRYKRFPMTNVVESLLAYPVMTGVFRMRLRQPISGVYALSQKALRSALADTDVWESQIGNFGVDPWLIARAVTEELSICEVLLGTARFAHSMGNLKRVFAEVTHAMLEQVDRYANWWIDREVPLASPTLAGSNVEMPPMAFEMNAEELLRSFKREFDHFDDTMYREMVSDALREEMERLADGGLLEYRFTAREWIAVLREFVLGYRFESRFQKDDLVDGLFPFFLARLATFIDEVKRIESSIATIKDTIEPDIADKLVRRGAELIVDRQAHLFIDGWDELRERWLDKAAEIGSYLPRLCAWEFIPHVEIVLPQELKDIYGNPVFAAEVYQELLDRYRGTFMKFLETHLGIASVADSGEVLSQLRRFFSRVNWVLDLDALPGDLRSAKGVRAVVDALFEMTGHPSVFRLTKASVERVLKRAVPRQLIAKTGCHGLADLLSKYTVHDALALAAWTDHAPYLQKVLDVIGSEADPSWFEIAPMETLVVDPVLSDGELVDVSGSTAISRLAGRLVLGVIPRAGMGEFPKLWYVLRVLKTVVGSEKFSENWHQFSNSGLDFGQRIVASVTGHWGRRILSAHHAFENQQQRLVMARIRKLAAACAADSVDLQQASSLLDGLADVYHLSITLPDATFVPLSAWTWASYCARGGLGIPSPLSSLVERDWATRDFLEAYLVKTGRGSRSSIDRKITELIGKGEESEDLLEQLIGLETGAEDLVVSQTERAPGVIPAEKLVRPVTGPILEPVPSHKWESKYVLNAAVVRLDGTIYILYRAFGDDKISRVGLAWTRDGVTIDGRMDTPIFKPEGLSTEVGGCEDPRVIVIEDRLYMLYTAFDGRLPQIAMASISIDAFLERRFDAWERHGLGFPGLSNKDAVLYPERFNGRYVVYHRIDPSMYISYLDDLNCPWPRSGQKIVVGPRPGMMWDGIKIGAGAQPIKTTHGWLNIYHGVDYERVYRLGVLFMDLNDPAKVLYQSPNPILEPEFDFEVGKTQGGDYWVPRVVFTCGAVAAEDKGVVGLDDEVLVYYGAADTAIGVAKGTLRQMVPILK